MEKVDDLHDDPVNVHDHPDQIGLMSGWLEGIESILAALQTEVEFEPIEIGFLPDEFDGLCIGTDVRDDHDPSLNGSGSVLIVSGDMDCLRI